MGGALGAVAMIALLVLGGVAMVMFMAGQQNPRVRAPIRSGQSSDQSSMNSPAPAPPVSPQPRHRVSSAGRRQPPQPSPVRRIRRQRPQSSPAGDVKTAQAHARRAAAGGRAAVERPDAVIALPDGSTAVECGVAGAVRSRGRDAGAAADARGHDPFRRRGRDPGVPHLQSRSSGAVSMVATCWRTTLPTCRRTLAIRCSS